MTDQFGRRGLLILVGLVALGCGVRSTPSPDSSPAAGALPWPADPSQTHPACSEAEAIALAQAYLKANPPRRPEDAGEHWEASSWNDGWAVATAATDPSFGEQQTNLFVDQSGRIVARRSGVNPTFSDGTENHRHNKVTFPWPADAKEAHPPTSEAEAIALVRALAHAADPDAADCWRRYSAMKFDEEWWVTILDYPPTPGHFTNFIIDPMGRIREGIGGE